MNDPHAPVVLAAFSHEMEAGLLVNALEHHGIKAKSSGEMVAGFRAEVPGEVKVLVSAVDLDRARRVLSEINTDSGEVDWSHVDIGQPSNSDVHTFGRYGRVGRGIAMGLVVFGLYVFWQALNRFGF